MPSEAFSTQGIGFIGFLSWLGVPPTKRRLPLNGFRVIGLAGKTGVGKTALSLMLLDLYPGFHRASFDDMVKQAVSDRFAIRLEELYGDEDAQIELTEDRAKAGMPDSLTVRQLVRWYGTDIVRGRNSNFWVIAMDKWLKLTASKGVPGIILDDVRFPNEANLVKRWRGLLVRIEPYRGHSLPPAVGDHPSEIALDSYKGFDVVYGPAFGETPLREVARCIAEHEKNRNASQKSL